MPNILEIMFYLPYGSVKESESFRLEMGDQNTVSYHLS